MKLCTLIQIKLVADLLDFQINMPTTAANK